MFNFCRSVKKWIVAVVIWSHLQLSMTCAAHSLWFEIDHQEKTQGLVLKISHAATALDGDVGARALLFKYPLTFQDQNLHYDDLSHGDDHFIFQEQTTPEACTISLSQDLDTQINFVVYKQGRVVVNALRGVQDKYHLNTCGSVITVLDPELSTSVRALTLIGRQDMSAALKIAVRGTVADTMGGYMAQQIGAGYNLRTHKNLLEVVTHKVLHGLNGAVTGAILKGKDGIVSGATAAIMAEIAVEMMAPNLDTLNARLDAGEDPKAIQREIEAIADIGRVAAASVALVTHQDVLTTIQTATLAVENNSLLGWSNIIDLLAISADLAQITHGYMTEDEEQIRDGKLNLSLDVVGTILPTNMAALNRLRQLGVKVVKVVQIEGKATQAAYRVTHVPAALKAPHSTVPGSTSTTSTTTSWIGSATQSKNVDSSFSSRVRRINDRMSINHEYAGKVYPLEKLPKEIRDKYPHSVPFTGTGHPDFSRYAIKKVEISVTGKNSVDVSFANKAAGFETTPKGYTWHHHHDGKGMYLIPKDIHYYVKHTGGVAKIKDHKK